MKRIKTGVIAASVMAILSGCSTTHTPEVQDAIDESDSRFEGGFEEQIKPFQPKKTKIGQVVDGTGYYMIDSYTIENTDLRRLPSVFESDVVIESSDGKKVEYTLDEFAAEVYTGYGISIDVSAPDLRILAEQGASGASNTPIIPASISNDSAGEYQQPTGQSQESIPRSELKLKPFVYKGTLKGLLDYVTKLNGIKWRYDDESSRGFMYTYDTKTFPIYDFGNDREIRNRITSNANQTSESGSGVSNKQYEERSTINFWDDIQQTINNMLSDNEHAKASFNRYTGHVTVTDSDFNLDKIQKVVDEINESTTTLVTVDFRIYRVTLDEGTNAGLNQNYLNDSLQNNVFGSFDLNFGAGELSPDISGNLGAFQQIYGGNFLSLTNQTHEFLMGFLNNIGTAKVAYETQVEIYNNGSFNDQDIVSREYIASIERSNFTTGVGQQNVSTERDEAIDGVNLSLRPRIIDDAITLEYSVSNDNFIRFEDAGLGAGFEGIKLKNSGANNIAQVAELQNGIPSVVKVTYSTEKSVSSQGWFSHYLWPFGGDESRTETKTAVIVTATAYYNNQGR